MTFDRRQFVTAALASAGLSAFPAVLRAAVSPAVRPLKILILGGTGFLGPHTVNYLCAQKKQLSSVRPPRIWQLLLDRIELY